MLIQKNKVRYIIFSFIIFNMCLPFDVLSRPITDERIRQDYRKIEEFVNRTETNIWLAKRAGAWAANKFHGISYKAFDSIPFAFFEDKMARKRAETEAFSGNALAYMNKVKSDLEEKPKTNDSIIAETLFDHLVDNLTISEAEKTFVKNNPKEIDKFLHQELTRSQYMNLTYQNFITKYYFEKESGKIK